VADDIICTFAKPVEALRKKDTTSDCTLDVTACIIIMLTWDWKYTRSLERLHIPTRNWTYTKRKKFVHGHKTGKPNSAQRLVIGKKHKTEDEKFFGYYKTVLQDKTLFPHAKSTRSTGQCVDT